jgi:hypothetical protein
MKNDFFARRTVFDRPTSLSIITGITFWRPAYLTSSWFLHNLVEFFHISPINSLGFKSGVWARAFAHKNELFSKKNPKKGLEIKVK